MLRFLFSTAVVAAAICLLATPAMADHHSRHLQVEVKTQLARYYHANGYLLAIGRSAHRTIYSSNATIRERWKRAAHWLVFVRSDAAKKLYALRHPNLNPQGAWPPHHALWLCISRYEGGVTSVNPNGHYGMLQMHAGWGYGTSEYASNDPQSVQEWAAERAYKASNYSSSFLYGQWFDYDGAAGECMQYAS